MIIPLSVVIEIIGSSQQENTACETETFNCLMQTKLRCEFISLGKETKNDFIKIEKSLSWILPEPFI